MVPTFYNINGIPTKTANKSFSILEWNNTLAISQGDNTMDLDYKLISLTHKVADRLFESIQNFYSKLPFLSTMFSYGGVDAEMKISKIEFEKWIQSEKSTEKYKVLYYYDFQNLTGSLQNLIQESRHLLCDFYKILNVNTFMLTEHPLEPNILMYASGQIVTNIFSKINHLFINLSSQLDFITKIAYEFENLPCYFNHYPEYRSNKILYGNLNRLKSFDFSQTVFEKDETIKLIISLRNEIIHNASFENTSKVYQIFEDNKLVEKYILIPDHTNGVFNSYKNRNRFFSTDTKLNEELPNLVTGFWKRMETTVDKINSVASKKLIK